MHIIDDILPYNLHKQMIDAFGTDTYHGFKYTHELMFAEKRLVDHASKYFDLSSMAGTEIWSNVNEAVPHWHVDKDEKLFDETGEMSYPLCTILYYPIVEDLEGGKITLLEEDSITITPKANRAVFFSSDIPHIVEPFAGKRVSVVSCPFSYNPL